MRPSLLKCALAPVLLLLNSPACRGDGVRSGLASRLDDGRLQAKEEATAAARNRVLRKRRTERRVLLRQRALQEELRLGGRHGGSSMRSRVGRVCEEPFITDPFDDPPAGCHEPTDLYTPIERFYVTWRRGQSKGWGGLGEECKEDNEVQSLDTRLLALPCAERDPDLLPLLNRLIQDSVAVEHLRHGAKEVFMLATPLSRAGLAASVTAVALALTCMS